MTDLREWIVIESSRSRGVFSGPDDGIRGYIPRYVAEQLLGRDLGGVVWFTAPDRAAMRTHPEWSDIEPQSGGQTHG